MRELEMNGQMVKLNFGMGFLRNINKTVSVPVEGMDGVKENVGLKYAVGNLLEGDTETLAEVLFLANGGCDPRISRGVVDQFIEDENTDIDVVFETVMGFLKTSNATKKDVLAAIENVEKSKAFQEAKLKMQMEAMA